jgi:hypothetical protein
MTDAEVLTEETKAKMLGARIQFLLTTTVAIFSDREKANEFARWLENRSNVEFKITGNWVSYRRPSYIAPAAKEEGK